MQPLKQTRSCVVGALFGIAVTACGAADSSSTPAAPNAAIAQVSISGASSLYEAQTATMRATAMTAAGVVVPTASFTWSSSDSSIATVDGGMVTGLKAGNTTIIAMVGSVSGSIAVVVNRVPVSAITIAPAAPTLTIGQTLQFIAVAKDSAGAALANRTVSWTSSNSAVATVTQTGLATALSPGTATIAATSEGKTSTGLLTVQAPAPVVSMTVSLAADHIIAEATSEIAAATLRDSVGNILSGRAVTWSSSNPTVAAVNSAGRISALAAGTAIISASSEGHSATASLTVEPRSQYESIANSDWDFLLSANDDRSPVWSVARQGWMPRSTDTRQQVVIDETFTVPQGQSVDWDNKIVWIRPTARRDIAILGTLTIHNSLLLWDQTEHQQSRFDVQHGGALVIQNSYAFSSNQFWVNWNYDDGATVSFDHFQGHIWTAITGGAVRYTAVNASTVWMSIWGGTRTSNVSVSDASSLYFELLLPAGTFSLTLPRKLAWQDWTLPSIWPGAAIAATNSFVKDRDVTLNNGTHATVNDTPDGFSVGWGISGSSAAYVDCELRDLANPGDASGVLYASKTWNLPCTNSSLTVHNSRLMRAWPFTNGNVHFRVYNSYLVDTRNYGGGATYEVYDSSLLLLSATSGGLMYVENSTLQQDIEVNGAGSAIYTYGLRTSSGSAPMVYQESGGRYVVLTVPGPPW
jgi:uncharacterized protein YjdB